MYFKKNPIFIVITGMLIAIGRFLMGFNPEDETTQSMILIFMGVVNYISFGIVFLFINVDALIACERKITKSGSDTQEKKHRKRFMKSFSYIFLFFYLLFGVIYICYMKSENWNDVMSIVSLAISIVATELSDVLGDFYYKIVIKIIK